MARRPWRVLSGYRRTDRWIRRICMALLALEIVFGICHLAKMPWYEVQQECEPVQSHEENGEALIRIYYE